MSIEEDLQKVIVMSHEQSMEKANAQIRLESVMVVNKCLGLLEQLNYSIPEPISAYFPAQEIEDNLNVQTKKET